MAIKWAKVFLRLALGAAFLSAVADRVGLWPAEVSAWGNMDSFLSYMQMLAPWMPEAMVNPVGWAVTILEVLLGLALILGVQTRQAGIASAALLTIFALSMSLFTGLKGALDYSVFSAAAAAFSLSFFKHRFLELDSLLTKNDQPDQI